MSKSSIGWRKAGISSLATAALVAGACVAGAGAASANTGFSFTRVNGTDRYGTSAAVAKEFGQATDVIVASGLPGHYPDALAANYLAGIKKAPVLLTKQDTTPPAIMQAIKDSGATNVWIVGGTGVITQAQHDSLEQAGYNVQRLSGSDRFATAADVINAGGTSSGEGIVATGLNFPDALGAGPLAYAKDMPLAISKTNSISQAEIDALKAAGVTKVLIVGGTKAVSPAVEAELAANGITVDKRLSGTDRAGTAAAVANYELSNGFTNTAVNVASGFTQGDGADALGGGALSGENVTPLLITNSDVHPGAATLNYLTANANTLAKGDLFGGTAAISKDAQSAMEAAAQAVTNNQSFTVTPATAVSMSVDTTDTTTNNTSDDRQYSVSGLDATKNYVVALVDAANVTVDGNGSVSFADSNGDNQADGVGSTTVAHISVVNGTPQTGDKVAVAGTGSINFTVEGDTTGSVIPVVYQDANANGQLDLVKPATSNTSPKAPSESFGIGGETTYTATEAGLGSSSPTVSSVNTAANYFESSTARYDYDSNDTYQYQGVGITMAQFESMLNKGDALNVAYNPDPNGTSTFNVTTDNVVTPGTPTAAVKNLDNGTTANDVQVTFTPNADAADGVSYQLLQGAYGAGTDGTFGTADDTTPTSWTAVSGTSQSTGSNGDVTITAKNVADGAYGYEVKAVSPVSNKTATSSASNEVVVPAAADTTRPTSTYADQTTNAGLSNTLGTGDVIKVVYSEPMAAPAKGDTIRVKDGDGTIGDIVNGTNAAFTLNAAAETVNGGSQPAGTVLTITLSGAPTEVAAGTTAGVQLPATITDQSGITDAAGNNWDLANSSDKQIG